MKKVYTIEDKYQIIRYSDAPANLVLKRVVEFAKKHGIYEGETAMQDDDFQVEAPTLLAELLNIIFDIENKKE